MSRRDHDPAVDERLKQLMAERFGDLAPATRRATAPKTPADPTPPVAPPLRKDR